MAKRIPYRVVLGVTGSIAAYKALVLLRLLRERGCDVCVVPTHSALRFVGEESFRTLSGYPVLQSVWDAFPASGAGSVAPAGGAFTWESAGNTPGGAEGVRSRHTEADAEGARSSAASFTLSPVAPEAHVQLSSWADMLLVAPASAHTLARMASGQCSDLLSTLALCFRGPRWIAPAMHEAMWEAPATQRNISSLQGDGVRCLGPVRGLLGNGETGMGRMLDPERIAAEVLTFAEVSRGTKPLCEPEVRGPAGSSHCLAVPAPARRFQGRKVLITGGATREPIDPVRFLSNASSGRMAVALARVLLAEGAEVVMVVGAMEVPLPSGVSSRRVGTVSDMAEAMSEVLEEPVDVVIMAAAVSDYRVANPSLHKQKKQAQWNLALVRNPDLLAELSEHPHRRHMVLVGFALETDDVLANAADKRARKGCDVVIANHASAIGEEATRAWWLDDSAVIDLGDGDKDAVAVRIIDQLAKRFASR